MKHVKFLVAILLVAGAFETFAQKLPGLDPSPAAKQFQA